MKFLTILLQPFIYLWVLFLLIVIMFPPSIIALPFKTATRFKITAFYWRIYFNLCLKTAMFVKYYCDDRRDIESKKVVRARGLYIGNHQSFVDIPMTYSRMVSPPIMKKSILYIPVFGVCAYSSGAIAVDRNDPHSRKKVMEEATRRLLDKNFNQLHYFPEGTRNRKSTAPKPVNEIKSRLILFAYQNDIPVYPFSIAGTQNVIRNKLIHFGVRVGIIYHEAVLPKNFENSTDFIEACWNKVIEGNQELTEKFARE